MSPYLILTLLALITFISSQAPRLLPLGGMADTAAAIIGILASAVVFIVLFNGLIVLRLYLDSRRHKKTYFP